MEYVGRRERAGLVVVGDEVGAGRGGSGLLGPRRGDDG